MAVTSVPDFLLQALLRTDYRGLVSIYKTPVWSELSNRLAPPGPRKRLAIGPAGVLRSEAAN